MPQIRLQRPTAILFDINGTCANTTFVERILIPFFKKNFKNFVGKNFTNEQVQRDVRMLRKFAASNGLPEIPTEPVEAVKNGVEAVVNQMMEKDMENIALAQLRFHVWIDAYQRQVLSTPIYSDVAIQMQKWRCDDGIKLFVVSNGWSVANRVFMSRTNQGDMDLLIDDYFDTTYGPLDKADTYNKILSQIGQDPNNVVFFTKTIAAAQASSQTGIFPILVFTHKESEKQLSESDKSTMPTVRTLNEVEFED